MNNQDEIPSEGCVICGKPVPGDGIPVCEEHMPRPRRDEQTVRQASVYRNQYCIVCGVALPPERVGELRCQPDQLEYTRRQVEGVSTAELDPRFGDTLSIWSERPPALASEPYAVKLAFRHREGHWLLFRLTSSHAQGISGQGLTSDWLAISLANQEVRRYAATPEMEVWRDLQGKSRASGRDDLMQRWGQPPPPPRREDYRRMFASRTSDYQPPDIVTAGTRARVPVYGLVAHPLGLAVKSIYMSGRGDEQVLTALSFTSRPEVEEQPARSEEQLIAARQQLMAEEREQRKKREEEEGTSSSRGRLVHYASAMPAAARKVQYPPVASAALEVHFASTLSYDLPPPHGRGRRSGRGLTERTTEQLLWGLNPEARAQLGEEKAEGFCRMVHGLLWSYAPDLVAEIAGSPTQVLQREFSIEGQQFTGELLYWDGRHPLAAFELEGEETPPLEGHLSGAAYGIKLEQLIALIEGLVVVNDRPELLAEYQSEHETHMAQLKAAYQGEQGEVTS